MEAGSNLAAFILIGIGTFISAIIYMHDNNIKRTKS
jgi:hypothetical protein